MAGASQNVQSLGAGGLYGGYTVNGGGGGFTSPVSHDALDRMRIGLGRTPSAEYPDGYLGTIRSRREDRLLDSLKNRLTQRSYQRGVHKGERIDQSDYFWPSAMQPDRGLRNEARGMRTGPLMQFAPPPHLVNDGKANTRAFEPAQVNQQRASQLARMRPSWR